MYFWHCKHLFTISLIPKQKNKKNKGELKKTALKFKKAQTLYYYKVWRTLARFNTNKCQDNSES